MTEILVTCTDCGTTLKVSGESPDGRFVRCPQCTTIFIATKLERTPSAGSSGPRLTCTDCGAIQYAVQPIAGGKFVRCMECGSVFRVPGPPVTVPAARLPAPVEPPRPAAVPPRSPLPVATFLDDIPEKAVAEPANARARAGSPNRRVGSREDVLDEAGEEESPPLARRRRRPEKSTNIWVPAAVIGAIAAATVLIIVGLAVLLKPSAKEQNDPLAMVLGPRGQATPTAGVPGSSPNAGSQPFPNNGQPAPQTPPGSGQNTLPPGWPQGGTNPLQPPKNPPYQPVMPRPPGPGPGAAKPPSTSPPADSDREAVPSQPRPGQTPGTAPNARPNPMQRFWPPGSLPGGMGNRRRFEQPPGQPGDGQAFDSAPNLQGRFESWLQDFELAKSVATRDSKDILILFDGSDWCGWSVRLASEVLFQSRFDQQMRQVFVPVFVDFPRKAQARSRVQDPARNELLARQFGVDGYPRLIVADAHGRPYGVDGYREGGADAYWQHLVDLRAVRSRRDQLLDAVARSSGQQKLRAAKDALSLLQENDLLSYYQDMLAEWLESANKLDTGNAAGYGELFFEACWVVRVVKVDPKATQELTRLVAEFEEWKKKNRFKDPDRAARLHLLASLVFVKLDNEESALDYIRQALECNPRDPDLLALLKKITGSMGGSGSGFVVAPGGYVMTNYHVVRSGGKIFVRLPGLGELVPAQVVATDKVRDMAVIRIKQSANLRLKPLTIAGDHSVNRGQGVAALGFPGGDELGSGLKLTTGVVSALPESANHNMLMLDARINPGNSGGPLCDPSGNVVGMVTMKFTSNDRGIDSYGAAIPGPDLLRFLKVSLKGYKPPATIREQKSWDEVDRLVSPSVLMIIVKG